ncbi:hypothetical protein WJX84_010138 [Apatococcus fuscideae]|uniref:Uncharacterized protein n=1 Tax=Apatococcus fuscideae TaxID=2026836 RepID=A0AAW1RGB8_9CHLO
MQSLTGTYKRKGDTSQGASAEASAENRNPGPVWAMLQIAGVNKAQGSKKKKKKKATKAAEDPDAELLEAAMAASRIERTVMEQARRCKALARMEENGQRTLLTGLKALPPGLGTLVLPKAYLLDDNDDLLDGQPMSVPSMDDPSTAQEGPKTKRRLPRCRVPQRGMLGRPGPVRSLSAVQGCNEGIGHHQAAHKGTDETFSAQETVVPAGHDALQPPQRHAAADMAWRGATAPDHITPPLPELADCDADAGLQECPAPSDSYPGLRNDEAGAAEVLRSLRSLQPASMAGGKQQAAKSTTKLAAGMASLSRSEAAGEQQAAFPVHRQSAEGISLEHEGVGKRQAVIVLVLKQLSSRLWRAQRLQLQLHQAWKGHSGRMKSRSGSGRST